MFCTKAMQEILNTLSANITFSNSTPIAKPIHTSNPIRRIVAANMLELPRGLIRMGSFHIAPDRGMTIMWFNNQKNLDEAFPGLKEFQKPWPQDLRLAVMPKKI